MPSLLNTVVISVALAAALYVPYTRMRQFLGVDYVTSPLRSDKCTLLNKPGLEGCEALALHQSAGIVYMACGNIERRKRWFPSAFAFSGKGEPAENESIFVLDLKTNDIAKLEPVGLDHELFVHGMDIYQVTPQLTAIHVVNHAYGGESIEVFEHTLGTTEMKHIETVKSPWFRALNSVGSVGRNAFYASNDFGAEAPWRRALEMLGWPTYESDVLYYNGRETVRAHKGFVNANGVMPSADGKLLFVAETITKKLHVFKRDVGTGELELIKVVDTPFALDNVSKDAQGRLYLASFPSLYQLFAVAGHYADKAPTVALRVVYNVDKDEYNITKFFEDDGTHASSTTHFIVDTERNILVAGTFFGKSITVCKLDNTD